MTEKNMNENYMRQYRQTLQLGLIKIIKELFPGEILKIPHSILDGIYCELSNSILSEREVRLIEQKLQEWVEQNSPIECVGKKRGYYHYKLDDTIIETIYPAFVKPSMIKNFKLINYPPGFILLFDPDKEFVLPEKLSATYVEAQRWLENLNLDKVQDVNSYIISGRSQELISIAEALHEKKISAIADMILEQKQTVRVVLISGPSSSGKTTFAQRLSTQLRVNGLRPVPLSLDNYFVNREDTPRDASGNYDFDSLEALDLKHLNQQIEDLIEGENVKTPIFDFQTGKRLQKGMNIQLKEDDILLIEGIHALNPYLLPNLNKKILFKIYISALFQLNIDSTNRVPTTEARLVRRIVRDAKYRSITPEKTLNQWASVRRGENTNVFRYQEEADVMFNSSLLYELNVLRTFAEPLLKDIAADFEHKDIAVRLLNLLSFFEPMDSSKIPFNSILREFIGGSIY